jgi:hypothetical protein
VTLFGIDAAAISLVFAGATSGTLGASDAAARVYDELQFTLGEGPCLDSVAQRAPVLVADLADANNARRQIPQADPSTDIAGPRMRDDGGIALPVDGR